MKPLSYSLLGAFSRTKCRLLYVIPDFSEVDTKDPALDIKLCIDHPLTKSWSGNVVSFTVFELLHKSGFWRLLVWITGNNGYSNGKQKWNSKSSSRLCSSQTSSCAASSSCRKVAAVSFFAGSLFTFFFHCLSFLLTSWPVGLSVKRSEQSRMRGSVRIF